MEHTKIIQDTLRELGIGKNYIPQKRTVVAIQLALENEDRLLRVKKGIYIPAAERCNCTWNAVERNIRMVVEKAWKVNRDGLVKMAGYPMSDPPTASEFIEIMAYHIQKTLTVGSHGK